MKSIAEELDTWLSNVQETTVSSIPPWTIKLPQVLLEIHDFPKERTHPLIFLDKFQEILEKFHDYSIIYTDGSKSGDKVRCAAVSQKITKKKKKYKLPKGSLIFTAEVYVIELSLKIMSESKLKNVLIFSDSLSVLSNLEGNKFNNPMIMKILHKINSMKNIILYWIIKI